MWMACFPSCLHQHYNHNTITIEGMDFQAVLLAGGPGSKMYPLTEHDQTKPLLPIANRPLISFQLEFLDLAGFDGT
jgi:CTP:molybdopterin cytidylyltransferase MocA